MKMIDITNSLRLTAYQPEQSKLNQALVWYQDKELLLQVNGNAEPYDMKRLNCMYDYQASHGELYFIEVFDKENWLPIGDVCLSRDDFAIVIGNKNYQNQGIGKLVLTAMIDRAKFIGFSAIRVQEIYDFNKRSQRLFMSAGFKNVQSSLKGKSYQKDLK